ncbi:hypothetical protein [Zhaonella formicivorans]|uniref:hypothetical protein n=1 Tax=Zhaonella formicivorans TaxID=2528593 RepID=UPI0010ECA79A|nr:hypothetical protein [Zhaonella formicivorans]
MKKIIKLLNPSIVEMRNDPALTDYIRAQVEEICERDQIERFVEPVENKSVSYERQAKVLETYKIIKDIDYIKIQSKTGSGSVPVYLIGCVEFFVELLEGDHILTFLNRQGDVLAFIPELAGCEVSAHKNQLIFTIISE